MGNRGKFVERKRARELRADAWTLQDIADETVGDLTDREYLMAGLGLYAGDRSERDGAVAFSNCNPEIVRFFCRWFRHFFEVDESRLRIKL